MKKQLIVSTIYFVFISGVLIAVSTFLVCCGFYSMSDNSQSSTTLEEAPQIKSIVVNGVSFKMIRIPAGEFLMGSPPNEKDREDDEGPQHRVVLNSFWMGETEVTQGLWKAVMTKNPSKFLDCGDECPVEQVSWNDIQKFIDKLNGFDQTNKYRLPTEAEWEYACRAGSSTRFSFGDDDFWLIIEHAWYNSSSTHPVAQKKPNAFGLYDMHGNVWEWCQDRYEENYYSHSPERNPKGPKTGDYRVVRGGSWLGSENYLRSADRGKQEPDSRHYRFLGFRLAMDHTN